MQSKNEMPSQIIDWHTSKGTRTIAGMDAGRNDSHSLLVGILTGHMDISQNTRN